MLGVQLHWSLYKTLIADNLSFKEGICIDVVYNNTTGFKVFQILEDGSILASHPGYVHYRVNHNTGIRADLGETNFLDIHVIPLQSDYVDGQALRCGYYKYIGNYKYKTVEGKMRTIRQYLEVVEKAQD